MFDGVFLGGEEGGQEFVPEMGEAKLVGVGFFERDELLAVLVLEVHGLESEEVEVGERAGGAEVQLHKVLALLVAVVDAVAAQKRSHLIVVPARQRQRDRLTAQQQQFHEGTAVILAAGVEGERHEEQVGLLLLGKGDHLSFLLIVGEH